MYHDNIIILTNLLQMINPISDGFLAAGSPRHNPAQLVNLKLLRGPTAFRVSDVENTADIRPEATVVAKASLAFSGFALYDRVKRQFYTSSAAAGHNGHRFF